MKKSDLTVGMMVENKGGQTGTVVSLEGWTKLRAMYMHKPEPITMDDGREVKVWGRRDATSRNIVVAWDYNPTQGDVVSLGQLVPVGTRAIRDAENHAAIERSKQAREERLLADKSLVAGVRSRLDDRADMLFGWWGIGERLNDDDRRLLKAVDDALDFGYEKWARDE